MRLISFLLLTACVGEFNERTFIEDSKYDYDGDGQTGGDMNGDGVDELWIGDCLFPGMAL